MRESPEKAMASERGVVALRLIMPAAPVLEAWVVSWEAPERFSRSLLALIVPPSPDLEVLERSCAP